MKSPIQRKAGAIFIPVKNIEKARDWYCDLLGISPNLDIQFGHLYILPVENVGVILDSKIYEEGKTFATPAFHFNTKDIHASYEYMNSKGVEVVTPIQHDHFFTFKDPDGNLLMICEC
ncbi:VOC family protein [Halobacillus karajensis]|uniref:Glyoxalase-like domain protein n=1 Tax=Halobacillus karajensis TaxID=195088 RepID=A0A024P5T7_9BACI|nr:VOC family protein [Halobacillus karajensis]CDQ17819.1 Glyoxalase-like domain protein [Halobacillus karajensis]CDQ24225.1 Glyoxalase-like domain protein [Halobacillus karajensis]CDQ29526.1 Glyoxalase-like domain protein [Halobacillus karajensis]